MVEVEPKRMGVQTFLDWHEHRTERFELVDGFPTRIFPPKGMVGHTITQNAIAQNVAFALTPAAHAKTWFAAAQNTAVRTGYRTIRYLSVVVGGGPRDGIARVASEPVVVAEIDSEARTIIDATDAVEEYLAHPAIRVIALIAPDAVAIKLYRRTDEGWAIERYHRLNRTIPLPDIGGELPVADIYYGLDPEIGPDLAIVD